MAALDTQVYDSRVYAKRMEYSIKVAKQSFNFSSSHFLIFKDGTREPLHGHNYRVMVHGLGHRLEGDMVFDFLHIKPIVREMCDSLDHRLLLPGDNPHLKIQKEKNHIHLTTPDGSHFTIPSQDVIIMPLPNTSVERLAHYLAHQIREAVRQRFSFAFDKIEVEVEETPGQSAIFVLEGESR